jgi:hypothetical protein
LDDADAKKQLKYSSNIRRLPYELSAWQAVWLTTASDFMYYSRDGNQEPKHFSYNTLRWTVNRLLANKIHSSKSVWSYSGKQEQC